MSSTPEVAVTAMTTENLLAFEREWLNRPQHDGAKMKAAHARFGVSLVRYTAALVGAVKSREAWDVDPVTCGVVRRRIRGSVRSKSLR